GLGLAVAAAPWRWSRAARRAAPGCQAHGNGAWAGGTSPPRTRPLGPSPNCGRGRPRGRCTPGRGLLAPSVPSRAATVPAPTQAIATTGTHDDSAHTRQTPRLPRHLTD